MRHLFSIREGLNPLVLAVPGRSIGRPPLEAGPLEGITVDLDRMVLLRLRRLGCTELHARWVDMGAARAEGAGEPIWMSARRCGRNLSTKMNPAGDRGLFRNAARVTSPQCSTRACMLWPFSCPLAPLGQARIRAQVFAGRSHKDPVFPIKTIGVVARHLVSEAESGLR